MIVGKREKPAIEASESLDGKMGTYLMKCQSQQVPIQANPQLL
jgi:hypothetical protein